MTYDSPYHHTAYDDRPMSYVQALSVAFFCGASLPVGFVLGWLASYQLSRRQAEREAPAKGSKDERPPADGFYQHADAAFRSFTAVTDNLSHDVGVHGERIAAATSSLADQTPEHIGGAVARIIEANGWLQNQLVIARSTIRKQSIELERRMVEANSDALTTIANRRAFDLELKCQLGRWQRYGTVFTLMLFDLDHFKRVNDRQGHLAGDAVLRATAEIIKTNLRDVDFVARFGGEEFAVILAETDHQSALAVADRIRKAIADAEIPWESEKLKVTVSVGVAALSRLDDEVALLKRADEALYISKNSGRNRTALASHIPSPEELAAGPASETAAAG
jgi:diguanylate cyclase